MPHTQSRPHHYSHLLVLLYLLGALLSGCNDSQAAGERPAQAQDTRRARLCDTFPDPVEGKGYQVIERLDGCPVLQEKIDPNAELFEGKDVPQGTIDQVEAQARERAEREVRLFLAAEKAGVLKQPRVQQKIMRLVGNTLLKERGVQLDISDEEARAYYAAHRDEFEIPEHRLGRHVLLRVPAGASADEEKAIHARLVALKRELPEKMSSGDFAAFAAKHSEDTETKGLGGPLKPTAAQGRHLKIAPQLAEALFSLQQPGIVSAPVRTGEGWHLVYFARAMEGKRRPFEKVDALVRSKMKRARVDEAVDALIEQETER